MWTTYATDISPAGIALIFAQSRPGPPPAVGDVVGHWIRRTYRGTFTLGGPDGSRTYRLIGDADGQWLVLPEADGPGIEGGRG